MIADGIDLVTAASELGHADATTTAKNICTSDSRGKSEGCRSPIQRFCKSKIARRADFSALLRYKDNYYFLVIILVFL
jgi:hypothetical protein